MTPKALMAVVVVIQFVISMTATPALVKVAKKDSDMTMGQSWAVALVQMILMILGFVLVSYFGSEKVAPEN